MSVKEEREPKKLKMNNDSSRSDLELSANQSASDIEEMSMDVAGAKSFSGTASKQMIEPDRMSIDFSTLPLAESVEQFLENPLLVRPKPEFITGYFNDEDTILTHAVKNQVKSFVEISLLRA